MCHTARSFRHCRADRTPCQPPPTCSQLLASSGGLSNRKSSLRRGADVRRRSSSASVSRGLLTGIVRAAAPHVVPGSVLGEQRPPPVPSAPGPQAARAGINHCRFIVGLGATVPTGMTLRCRPRRRGHFSFRTVSVLRASRRFPLASASKLALVNLIIGGDSLVRGPRGHCSQVFAWKPSGHSV